MAQKANFSFFGIKVKMTQKRHFAIPQLWVLAETFNYHL